MILAIGQAKRFQRGLVVAPHLVNTTEAVVIHLHENLTRPSNLFILRPTSVLPSGTPFAVGAFPITYAKELNELALKRDVVVRIRLIIEITVIRTSRWSIRCRGISRRRSLRFATA